jgi:sulfite reductase (NADPH) flavoprotein alpha-component
MPEVLAPHIPDDAPFSAAQRAWLNGYLAGLYSYTPLKQSETERLRVAVLYGSQTGTSEGLARKLTKHLRSAGLDAVLSSLAGYVPATLAAERCALFIVSTYGEGDAPDGAQPFFQQLCVEHFPLLQDLSYAVLALGDSHYEHFCQFGKDLDAKLRGLGATRLLDRAECDVEVDIPYNAWKTDVEIALRRIASRAGEGGPAPVAEPASQSKRQARRPQPKRRYPNRRENTLILHPSSRNGPSHLRHRAKERSI